MQAPRVAQNYAHGQRQPKIMSLVESHIFILSIFEQCERGVVLDCPCGAGALTLRLMDQHHKVYCCDIDASHFELDGLAELRIADLNVDSLPYEDAVFDYVISANGLHRLYKPDCAIREFYRVLKPNGQLLLAWPNYASTARRLQFILTGTHGKSIDQPTFDQKTSLAGANVRVPLLVPRVYTIFAETGFELERIATTSPNFLDRLVLPISVIFKPLWNVGDYISRRHTYLSQGNTWEVLRGGSTVFLFGRKASDSK